MKKISLKIKNQIVVFDLDTLNFSCMDSNHISMGENSELSSSSERCTFISVDLEIEGAIYNFDAQISNGRFRKQAHQKYFSAFCWLTMKEHQSETEQKKFYGEDSLWDSIANVLVCVLINTRYLSTEWVEKYAQEFITQADEVSLEKLAS